MLRASPVRERFFVYLYPPCKLNAFLLHQDEQETFVDAKLTMAGPIFYESIRLLWSSAAFFLSTRLPIVISSR
jgi:hypothetical protein